jgi:TonB family protein
MDGFLILRGSVIWILLIGVLAGPVRGQDVEPGETAATKRNVLRHYSLFTESYQNGSADEAHTRLSWLHAHAAAVGEHLSGQLIDRVLERGVRLYRSHGGPEDAVGLIKGFLPHLDAGRKRRWERRRRQLATGQSDQSSSAEEEKKIFMVVEEQPELIGGMKALQEAKEYPEFAKKAGIEGRVIVQFVVDEQGNVQDPHVTRGVHKLLNKAAIEAIEQMRFKPGKQRGEAVSVQMSLPVTFRLQ